MRKIIHGKDNYLIPQRQQQGVAFRIATRRNGKETKGRVIQRQRVPANWIMMSEEQVKEKYNVTLKKDGDKITLTSGIKLELMVSRDFKSHWYMVSIPLRVVEFQKPLWDGTNRKR